MTSPAAARRWWSGRTPAAGGAAMATAIISVALRLAGQDAASAVFLVAAIVVWLLLAALFADRLLLDRRTWKAQAETPAALTAIAATTVLGTRLSLQGRQGTAAALLILSAVLWPVLLPSVVRHWAARLPGAGFLVCVATQGLAVLAGTLALAQRQSWLLWVALACFVPGLLLYAAVLARFDLRQLRTGSGDQWVAGGALAISALAGTKLVTASAAHGPLRWAVPAHGTLRTLTLVLLVLDLCWFAVLLACEVRWPRPHYDVRRWSTVFPVGMTVAACLAVAAAAEVPAAGTAGRVLLWPAVALWAFVLVGAVRSARAERGPGQNAGAGTPGREPRD
ncbi:tellurite resistance/C4-dicarboxylate transporter family protein [Streptomyces sp. H39-S7]|uniref:tellurite resistance/C4-dicarboxylate transporter family protein n=1 Tax=Streptomyces sp. H39-S7 TaxID=3004357 RepID=UPI0022AF8380|nr:tellurite resistance/C4-dicarboxylate transporter family protein [Streptomyces sp. H39-S7]MCZ4123349.1 tellurite resistance/C4-dicarboxylate transporter family protein [Streptomyces sp. H39-S7]